MSIEGALQSIWPVPPQWWLLAQWQSTSAHSAACALDRIALVHALPVHIIFKILSLSFKFFGRNQMLLKLIQCTPSPERCNDATELLAMSPKVFAFGIEKAKKKKKKDGKRLVCVQKINQFASESDDLFGWVMQRDARHAQDTGHTVFSLCACFPFSSTPFGVYHPLRTILLGGGGGGGGRLASLRAPSGEWSRWPSSPFSYHSRSTFRSQVFFRCSIGSVLRGVAHAVCGVHLFLLLLLPTWATFFCQLTRSSTRIWCTLFPPIASLRMRHSVSLAGVTAATVDAGSCGTVTEKEF